MMADGRAPSAELVGWISDRLRGSGQLVECEIRGESMGPGMPDRSTVRIRCDGAEGAPIGAVVALRLGGALTVHRLVHRGRSPRARGWVVTEGDANLTCDAPVHEEQLVGLVDAVRTDTGDWRAIGIAVPIPLARGRVARAVRHLVCAALELHPRVAHIVKGGVVLAMTPVVWLRPYPAGAERRASVAHRTRS